MPWTSQGNSSWILTTTSSRDSCYKSDRVNRVIWLLTPTPASPCIQTVLRIAGAVRRDLISFTTYRPHMYRLRPLSAGVIVAELVWDCATVTVRGTATARPACSSSVPPHFTHAHIGWKQMCAINYKPKVALPSKFCPRTHQLSRGWREISPR